MIPIFNKPSNRKILTLSWLLIISLFMAISPIHPDGQEIFSKAYRLEESDPDESIRLYRQALGQRLDKELRKAAVWRLFYLYKKNKEYSEAILISDHLSDKKGVKRVLEDLKTDIKFEWKINDNALDHYWTGIHLLNAGKTDAEGHSHSDHFLMALKESPGNALFREEILNRLVMAGRDDEVLRMIGSEGSGPEEQIIRADLLLKRNERNNAESILRSLAASEVYLTNSQKFRLLYLLGRIYRDRGDIPNGVRYFRYSTHYATGTKAVRNLALAAYALYRGGYNEQAYGLVSRLPGEGDSYVELLSLVLAVDVRNDEVAKTKLLKYRKPLEEQKKKGNNSFLIQRALHLTEEIP